jgi:hypothetical protein
MNLRIKTIASRLFAQLAGLAAVAAVLVATVPAVASSDGAVKPTVTTHGNGGICFQCPPRDEAGHVAVVKG